MTDNTLVTGRGEATTSLRVSNGDGVVAEGNRGSHIGLDDQVLNLRSIGNIVTAPVSDLGAALAEALRTDSAAARAYQAIQDRGQEATTDALIASDANTPIATLTHQFFLGKIPTAAGLEYLVLTTGPNPNNLNSAYYQSFSLENRYINFAVNLGALGEGRADFSAEYGDISLAAATRKAYGEIFGTDPTDTKVDALLAGGRDLYFAAYGGDGLDGIGAKAAMVGWLLAEAQKANLGVYAQSNAAFLSDLIDGATYNVDLVGVYSKPDYVYSA